MCIPRTWYVFDSDSVEASVTDHLQHGGLYCDNNGNIQKPFPNKPYCEPGTGAVGAQNTLSKNVAFCQTVLPGNEAMLIPTNVDANSWAGLAVPGPDYWIGSSAQ
jgi:hypothetical protein